MAWRLLEAGWVFDQFSGFAGFSPLACGKYLQDHPQHQGPARFVLKRYLQTAGSKSSHLLGRPHPSEFGRAVEMYTELSGSVASFVAHALDTDLPVLPF